MAKLTENASRDVNIAFANELIDICDELDIDVWELISLANRHPRVNILQPGPGVGGHCIAVDPWFIVSKSPAAARLIRSAREINDDKIGWVVEKIKLLLADYLLDNPHKSAGEVSITCYGLAFKPDIDDLRESPALQVAIRVNDFHSGQLVVIEPNISTLPAALSGARLADLSQGFGSGDIHVLLVNHREFSGLDFSSLKNVSTFAVVDIDNTKL